MKKKLIALALMLLMLCAFPVSALAAGSTGSLTASYSSDKITFSGSVISDVKAVAVLLFDANGDQLAITTCSVTSAGSFSGHIGIGLTNGMYTVKAANYEGGAFFAEDTFTLTPSPVIYTITTTAGNGGSISPTGNIAVTSGMNQTFTITPNSNYSVANVIVDGVSQGNISSYTFYNVASNHTIAATFSYHGGNFENSGRDTRPTTPTNSFTSVETIKSVLNNLPSIIEDRQLSETEKNTARQLIDQIVKLPEAEKSKLDAATTEKLERLMASMYPQRLTTTTTNTTSALALKASGLALQASLNELSSNTANVSVMMEMKPSNLSATQEKTLLDQFDITRKGGVGLLPFDFSIHKTVNGISSNITETTVPIHITISLPSGFDPKGNYFMAREHNGVMELLETVNHGDGTISFKSSLFSTYVLIYNNTAINLSYYSNNLFNIYENSRVVYAAQKENAIYLKGYAFDQYNNYSKKDAFVRELIFLDKHDPSNPEKAYRIPLPAVYDSYLSKNKTLNPNGAYNYNYAYFGGWMNLNQVRRYTKSKSAPLVSLPKGEYLVYIRMSDGKRSNLISLRNTKNDVVLPSQFQLVAGTNDIVFTKK